MAWEFDLSLPKRECKYCKEEYFPTSNRNTNCLPCQFSDTRRKKYSKINEANKKPEKFKHMVELKEV